MGGLLIGPDGLKSFNSLKGDIWAVGICLIAALTNEDYNRYYDWRKLQIMYSLIQDRIANCNKYVEGLNHSWKIIISLMLEIDEGDRCGLGELIYMAKTGHREIFGTSGN